MTKYEQWSIVVAIITLAVGTVGLVFVAMQIKFLAQQLQDAATQADQENTRQRQHASMDFTAATIGKLQELYGQVPISGSAYHQEFLAKALERESSEFVALRDYLNYLEDLCVGVNMSIFDKNVVYRASGSRITNTWQLYEKWILQERTELQRPRLFAEIEECALSFSSRARSEDSLTR